MAGTKGRSGGNRTASLNVSSDHDAKPPTKPPGMSRPVSAKWVELVSMLPVQVLKNVDGYEIRILATLLVQSDVLEKELAENRLHARYHRLYLNNFKEIHRLSAVFGLNPADRARLGIVEDSDEPDVIQEFLNQIAVATNDSRQAR